MLPLQLGPQIATNKKHQSSRSGIEIVIGFLAPGSSACLAAKYCLVAIADDAGERTNSFHDGFTRRTNGNSVATNELLLKY